MSTNSTPLESFINHKAQIGMQCGNYSIDVPELKEGEQYRFHFDATACVGCHCCEDACNELQNNPADVKWRRVGEMGGEFPQVLQFFNSMSCNHCIDPACIQACPAGAIEIEVVHKEEWIKYGMEKEGVVPHLPNVEITKPTTRYTLPENMPELKPADERLLKPAHAELPLVFLTVLTQVSLHEYF